MYGLKEEREVGKLKLESISKMKESQFNSKKRCFENNKRRMIEKIEKKNLEQKGSRKLNSVIIGSGESILHNYAKFITSLVIRNAGYNVITEFPIVGAEIDVVSWELGIAVELQDKGNRESVRENKLNKYEYYLNNGILNDVFVIDLKDFTGNLEEDYTKMKERLGL